MNIDEQVELLMQGTEYGDEDLKKAMTAELRERLLLAEKEGRPLRVYCGFDPTHTDLHLGHTIPMQKLRQFQELGHEVTFLIGNYTALVAFHTEHEVYASPRRSGVYDATIVPIENYENVLFANDEDVYLIWIEPNPYEHVYLPNEFSPIAKIETILENEDGGIYLLHRLH